ncbi:dicarboxylate transporter 2.1, chloroplastic-like [Bidens hawaiensis]|uniref:dicarboxylate transporter 2.1, chloroplastic-like n=1 Tax=Bidens hawaiensis TaxID=980011 RepID=UPI00404B7A72
MVEKHLRDVVLSDEGLDDFQDVVKDCHTKRDKQRSLRLRSVVSIFNGCSTKHVVYQTSGQFRGENISWFKAACFPALASLMLTPLIIYKIFPPEIKHTADAPNMAKTKLEQMGPVKRNEWIMLGTMLVTVALWIDGESLDIKSVVAAMLGLSALLILGVLSWDDCLSEKSAWDTLAWFAVLIGMAGELTTLGVVSWLSKCVANLLKALSVGWHLEILILQSVYFLIHYLFAGQTAHVGALYSAFLQMHLTAKVPGTLSALALAFNTCLFGALTHYSSGQAAVYYGAGYVKLPDVFKLGIVMAFINIIIWGLIGSPWWKILGLY